MRPTPAVIFCKCSSWWRVWCESVKWHLLVGGGQEYLYFGCVWWEVFGCVVLFFFFLSLFTFFCSQVLQLWLDLHKAKLQVCSAPAPSLLRDQGGNSSNTLGKGLRYFMCDMKADELIGSWLRCSKYWCICYSMNPLLNLSQKAGNTLGLQESFAIHKSCLTLVYCSPFLEAQCKIFRNYL